MTKKKPIEQRIKQLAAAHPDIAVVWLYGSRARNTATDNSDYDLAVAFKSFIKDSALDARLRPESLALDWQQTLSTPLSVVDINLAPIPLAMTVVDDDRPLYVADIRRKMMEEQRIRSRWEHEYEIQQ
ncbi:type VII toxin-antitoxin system MntA family adenylyltransferase antitoxin [Bowmanella denitrificans]|uniref:type VII toxin-antitoxin system MntA family adenylyltransferase antitoxin n=1 Tax=Bowmanella denitrificans TaxID=366582 RepID=UPI000C9B7F2F|nr:nucleotidyltransferase domain-containing protein [Bowmanella denitrificans]